MPCFPVNCAFFKRKDVQIAIYIYTFEYCRHLLGSSKNICLQYQTVRLHSSSIRGQFSHVKPFSALAERSLHPYNPAWQAGAHMKPTTHHNPREGISETRASVWSQPVVCCTLSAGFSQLEGELWLCSCSHHQVSAEVFKTTQVTFEGHKQVNHKPVLLTSSWTTAASQSTACQTAFFFPSWGLTLLVGTHRRQQTVTSHRRDAADSNSAYSASISPQLDLSEQECGSFFSEGHWGSLCSTSLSLLWSFLGNVW